MTEQQKAEAYVREKLPELMELSFGCEVVLQLGIISYQEEPLEWRDSGEMGAKKTVVLDGQYDWNRVIGTPKREKETVIRHHYTHDNYSLYRVLEIIGHPIQLQHWLRVLEKSGFTYYVSTSGHVQRSNSTFISFTVDLTTGQPATEADYKAFNDIVGI
jgi:hypothetical protein